MKAGRQGDRQDYNDGGSQGFNQDDKFESHDVNEGGLLDYDQGGQEYVKGGPEDGRRGAYKVYAQDEKNPNTKVVFKVMPQWVTKTPPHKVLKGTPQEDFKTLPQTVLKTPPQKVLKGTPQRDFKTPPQTVFKSTAQAVHKTMSQEVFKSTAEAVQKTMPQEVLKALP